MSKFDKVISSVLTEQEDSHVMVKRDIEAFFKKFKKDFRSPMQAKKLSSVINEEDDDVVLISLVSKFFELLNNPEEHEEFINKTLGLL